MKRVNNILAHPLFLQHMEQNEAAEQGRIFCRHDMGHLLDVARIAMILNLEEGLGLEKEILYGAALLHDIGRHEQYENETPHEEAGARIALEILGECGYNEKETSVIVKAIRLHRTQDVAEHADLSGVLCRADKMSRPCFCCKAESACNWGEEKKNKKISL
ncbi:MAG: HD domain-containing protein [Lachnospiraceae bacterium]|nr:HD domain-containing protein [Lachnospiraceae bacterium]